MRALMMIGSLAMVGSGIFCLANGSAAFISVAFIIGLIFGAMGIVEIVIGRRADFDAFGEGVGLTADGVLMLLFGLVIISGQITDDITAEMLFALWMMIEAVIGITDKFKDFSRQELEDVDAILGVAMLAISIYTFFNTRLLNISAIVLVGTAVMILGIRRLRMSFDIEYNRPGYMTGNQAKLEEAMEDEKKALAKAKEGIREQKAAKRRIDKIREDIAQERSMMNETSVRNDLSGSSVDTEKYIEK